MPPEQANGDVANLDRRADVFGLGAILCEVLTGKPPYVGRSAEEVRRQAANGDLADAIARLDGCGADEELIVLTKACLSPEAKDRPKDAQVVADALASVGCRSGQGYWYRRPVPASQLWPLPSGGVLRPRRAKADVAAPR